MRCAAESAADWVVVLGCCDLVAELGCCVGC